MTEAIEEELHQADIPPGAHVVDAGYVSARVLVNSKPRFGIEVLGPVPIDTQWQARTPSGIDESTVCAGLGIAKGNLPDIRKASSSWSAISRKRHPDLIKIQFSTTDCGSCPPFHDCIHPRGNISGER